MSGDGPFEHERQRLHTLVDRWIDGLNGDAPLRSADVADQRIDTAVIGGILRGTDNDGDDVETPSYFAETSGTWQQVGLFTQLLDIAAHGRSLSGDDSDG